jgi:hypothetical protein
MARTGSFSVTCRDGLGVGDGTGVGVGDDISAAAGSEEVEAVPDGGFPHPLEKRTMVAIARSDACRSQRKPAADDAVPLENGVIDTVSPEIRTRPRTPFLFFSVRNALISCVKEVLHGADVELLLYARFFSNSPDSHAADGQLYISDFVLRLCLTPRIPPHSTGT